MKASSACGRRYDREFKENAIALVRGSRSISQVARDLGWHAARRLAGSDDAAGSADSVAFNIQPRNRVGSQVLTMQQEHQQSRA